MDFDKVFTAFRNCISEPKCKDCPWEQCEQFNQKKVTIPVTLALDVLNLLKEHGEQIKNRDESLEKAREEIKWLREMLKEQEAVEAEVEVINEIDRLYRCPRCHKHFFYEKQKYCDQCGQAVKWE